MPRISKRGALGRLTSSAIGQIGLQQLLRVGIVHVSRVTRRTPVSIRFSTFLPLRCATIVFTPR